jgi:HAD superfamily hydrolase (TIGR01509 family)
MNELRAGVLFDVDGTLLDTNYLHVLAWWQAFRDTGHEQVTMAAIHQTIGIASGELVEHILGTGDEATVEAHSARYAPLREQVTAFPQAANLLIACADRGFTVVLATSGQESDLDWMQPAIGAAEAVTGATTSADVGPGKPAPDLLTTAMDQHQLDPAATVVIGDTVWDVGSARKAGLPCIALTCGGIGRAELIDAGAAAVYTDPADLLDHIQDSPLARPRAPHRTGTHH